MPTVFISYRRADSGSITNQIYDHLAQALGPAQVFRDIESIPLGKDFRAVIEREVLAREVMLVIIGPQWASITNADGQRRLHDPNDFVRIEVELALRHDREVVPVLVDGATMPAADDLPPDLRPLAFRNAAQLRSGADFTASMDWLVNQLTGGTRQRASRGRLILAAVALLLLIAAAGIALSSNGDDGTGDETPVETQNELAQIATEVPTRSTATDLPPPTNTTTTTATGTASPTTTASATATDTAQPTASPTPSASATPTETVSIVSAIDVAGSDCISNLPMAFIPQSTFAMGRDQGDEAPIRQVTLDAYCIDVFEVTNTQYAACVEAGACSPPQDTDSRLYDDYTTTAAYARFPIINLTWDQAQAFCTLRGGRLPTEAEWELAARYDAAGEMTRVYPWGDASPDASRANYSGVGIGDVVEVGQYPAGRSALGLQDMSGNVAEWVQDWYGIYTATNQSNPTGPTTGEFRVVRGGSYADNAGNIRSTARDRLPPANASNRVGLRCVVSSST